MLKALYFLFPLPVIWLSLSLVSSYWAYYDIGINASANSLGLFFIVAPSLIFATYTTAVIVFLITRALIPNQKIGLLIGCTLVFTVAIGLFRFHTYTPDYPTNEPQDLAVFLEIYFKNLLQR